MNKVALEQVYKQRDPTLYGVPLCILDFRVALHSILNTVGEYAGCIGHEQCPSVKSLSDEESSAVWVSWLNSIASTEQWASYIRASWALKLNRGPDMLPRTDYRVIVVDDNKQKQPDGRLCYWRHLSQPSYKGTRSLAADNAYKTIKDIGHELVQELSMPFYTEPLYEADDWAGLAYRVKLAAAPESLLATRTLFYSTVDSDWLQLVHDATHQLWANTGPWPSRLKNEAETRAYVLKRMGERIDKPNEIALVKQKTGDDADNLAVGSALALFDLCNAHPDYDLAKLPCYGQFVADLSSPGHNTRFDVLKKSVTWLSAKALPICVRP